MTPGLCLATRPAMRLPMACVTAFSTFTCAPDAVQGPELPEAAEACADQFTNESG